MFWLAGLGQRMERLTRGERKRLALFELYAANVVLYRPDLAGRFSCPVCAHEFVQGDVLGQSPRVNVAHVYPDSLGGKLLTLECERCNGRLNTAGDSTYVQASQNWQALLGQGGKPWRGRITVPNELLGVAPDASVRDQREAAWRVLKTTAAGGPIPGRWISLLYRNRTVRVGSQ